MGKLKVSSVDKIELANSFGSPIVFRIKNYFANLLVDSYCNLKIVTMSGSESPAFD